MIPAHIAQWALNRRKAEDEPRVAAVVATHVTDVRKPKKKAKRKSDEVVLETKGGGGYVPPPQPSPQEQAAARDWEAQQEFAREQRRADAERLRLAEEKKVQDAAWTSSKGAAYNNALSSGTGRLSSMGLGPGDEYGVYDQFTGRINQNNLGLTVGGDYSTAFSPTILDEILGTSRTGQRNKYKTAFNSQVSPYFAEDEFGGSRDDAILASILDQQYQDAMGDLTSARDRGQANQIVYDRALRDLGTAKSTANTELQGIGRGVLENIQTDINRRRQGSLDTAAGWDFGTTYDPSAEAGRIRSYAGERGQQLEGDIRGAVGGKEFFDVSSLLGKAQARVGNQTTPTGTSGTGTSALYDTFQNEAERDATNTRANEGIF